MCARKQKTCDPPTVFVVAGDWYEPWQRAIKAESGGDTNAFFGRGSSLTISPLEAFLRHLCYSPLLEEKGKEETCSSSPPFQSWWVESVCPSWQHAVSSCRIRGVLADFSLHTVIELNVTESILFVISRGTEDSTSAVVIRSVGEVRDSTCVPVVEGGQADRRTSKQYNKDTSGSTTCPDEDVTLRRIPLAMMAGILQTYIHSSYSYTLKKYRSKDFSRRVYLFLQDV